MGRGKLNMNLISNERSRMVTYHKRKKGLTKKVQEFRILCDVDACVIIYGPKFNNRPLDIETWPTDQSEMKRIIDRYRFHSNERKKSEDLSHFFQTRKKKLDDEIGKLHKACLEAKFPKWDNRLNSLEYQQLCLLNSLLQTKLEVAMSRVSNIKGDHYLMVDDKSEINIIQESSSNSNNKSDSMANTFANALHYQKNMELQAANCMNINPFDDLPFNVNPQNSPMLMMMMMKSTSNSGDLIQFGSPVADQTVGNNVMMLNNNGRAHQVNYFGLNRQMQVGLMPNVNICSQMQNQIPQFSEFCDMNVFEMKNNKRQG